MANNKEESELVASEEEATKSEPEFDESKETPPYKGLSWYDKFIDEISKSRKIDSVTLNFAQSNITPDVSDARKFLSGLRFLRLIQKDGTATEKMNWLRLTGEDFKTRLGQILQEGYVDLMKNYVLEQGDSHKLVNYFINNYDFSPRQADGAAKIFLNLATKAGLTLSQDLTSFYASGKGRRSVDRVKRVPTAIRKQSANVDQNDEPKEDVEVSEPQSGQSVQISLNMTLDSKTPTEIWKLVLRRVFGDEQLSQASKEENSSEASSDTTEETNK